MSVSSIGHSRSCRGSDRGLRLARGGISSLPLACQLSPFFLTIGKRIAHSLAWLVMSKAIFHVAHYSPVSLAGHGANLRSSAP